jgi:hypothetical protein
MGVVSAASERVENVWVLIWVFGVAVNGQAAR